MGDSDTGRGILLCTACGEPYRDHPLTEQCKALNGIRITAPSSRKRRPMKQCRVCGADAIRGPSMKGRVGSYLGFCRDHAYELGGML